MWGKYLYLQHSKIQPESLYYLIYGSYRAKDENGRYCIDTNHHCIYKYKSVSIDALIPKSVAKSLNYLVDIVQDSAHSKEDLKLKVDEYCKETHDKLMLLSCVYIYMNILKWFACTMLTHQDKEINATLWQEINNSRKFTIKIWQ